MKPTYDVIVVGARCAGAPIAMLLARSGHHVLLLDRDTFPSDTISTHLLHPPAVAALRRWGLLDRVRATGCPPIDTYVYDFGPVVITGAPGTAEEPVAYSPRRTVLDPILIAGAAEAGVEFREGFTVEELVLDDGRVTGIRGHGRTGGTFTEQARVVVGADGRHSLVARTVRPETYQEKPPLEVSYYSYWSGLPMGGRCETYIRPGRGFAAWPTNDGRTLVVVGRPVDQFETIRHDFERHYLETFDLVPSFGERIRAARREERVVGTFVPNYFRRPFGPGWALVGDAGYHKDPITAQGILDAFRDAELCATALDAWLTGARPFAEGMAEYQALRDRQVLAMYEFTAQIAALQPPPPELQQVLKAVQGNREAMDAFVQVNAGVMSPAEFFSEENLGRIFATAAG